MQCAALLRYQNKISEIPLEGVVTRNVHKYENLINTKHIDLDDLILHETIVLLEKVSDPLIGP